MIKYVKVHRILSSGTDRVKSHINLGKNQRIFPPSFGITIFVYADKRNLSYINPNSDEGRSQLS